MPRIKDIAAVAEAVEQCPIGVLGNACVAVRSRKSSCRRCEQACPFDAIEVTANEVRVSSSLCVGCGACIPACPAEAIVMRGYADEEVAAAAASSLSANDGIAMIACARIASKHLVDAARFAEVPCLARVDESLLVSLVAQGARELILVDGNCATCKHRASLPAIDEAEALANGLLGAHGSSVRVQRASAFPETFAAEDARALRSAARRGFFTDVARSAKDAAVQVAQVTLAQELGISTNGQTVVERRSVNDKTALPQIRTSRHERAIDALDMIGAPCTETISSRLFGAVSINMARCIACGSCATFCPTGALRRDPAKKATDPVLYLEFSASECIQCGLCADVCWKKCIKLSPNVPAEQLYDFEPQVFETYEITRHRNPAW